MDIKILPDDWRQMVRDFEGRWGKYEGVKSSVSGSTYFFGRQDYEYYLKNKDEQNIKNYVTTNLEAWKFLDRNLKDVIALKTYYELLSWFKEIRGVMNYKEGGGELHSSYLKPSTGHTKIVFGDVITIAEKYGDPYPEHSDGPKFADIPDGGQPSDLFVSPLRIDHYYPHPKYFPQYVRISLDALKKIVRGRGGVSDIAFFYQITLNAHLFEVINNSLLMNIVNYLLRERGFRGIEHGILDFVAYRLAPKNFAKYFREEVLRVQNDGVSSS
jgi:hypothetical protein